MSLTTRETIAEVLDAEQPLRNTRLADLSDLSAEEMEYWRRVWVRVGPERRRAVVCRLVELAEDNCELNYDAIFRDCLQDRDDIIRGKAVAGLGESEDTALIGLFLDLLERDPAADIQAAAAAGLGRFALLAELKKLRDTHKTKLSRALLGAFGDTSRAVAVRRRALEAVAPLSLPPVEKAIEAAYRSHDRQLKIGAIYAMGKNCRLSWLPVLLGELASSDVEARYEAAGACGEMGSEEAVPRLMELTGDPDVDVQLAAVRALGGIGGDAVRKCLRQCLDSPGEAVRQTAGEILNELEATEAPFDLKL